MEPGRSHCLPTCVSTSAAVGAHSPWHRLSSQACLQCDASSDCMKALRCHLLYICPSCASVPSSAALQAGVEAAVDTATPNARARPGQVRQRQQELEKLIRSSESPQLTPLCKSPCAPANLCKSCLSSNISGHGQAEQESTAMSVQRSIRQRLTLSSFRVQQRPAICIALT